MAATSGSPTRAAAAAAARFRSAMAALGLLASLTGAPGLLTPRPGPAPPGPAPPFRELRVDPERLQLSWERVEPGPRAACRKGGQDAVWEDAPGATRCTFRSLSRCRVTNFTVFLPGGGPGDAASIAYPESDPDRPGAAVDLRCRVHDVVRMTCRWGRGPGAPPDVQYRMFYGPASQAPGRARECPRYDVTDGRGARLGCRLDDVTGLPALLAVTVTGGGAGRGVSCSDAAVDLPRAEALAPPTLAASCNGSEAALLRWDARSLFHRDFRFLLQINASSRAEPQLEWTYERHFRVPNPGSASFRVRARPEDPAVGESGWSRTAALDCGPRRGPGAALTGGLAGLGAGLALLTSLLLLLGRRPLRRRLCPPIPRMKDPLGAEPAAGRLAPPPPAAPEDCPVTLVTEA